MRMKKTYIIFGLILIGILILYSYRPTTYVTSTKFVCPNGAIVNNPQLCPTRTIPTTPTGAIITSNKTVSTNTTALEEVKKENKFVVDKYHSNYMPYGISCYNSYIATSFCNYIVEKKFGKIAFIDVEPITPKYLNSVNPSVLILSSIVKAYDDQEIKTIINFVKEGGKLIVYQGDGGKAALTNELIKNFGIQVDEGIYFYPSSEIGITSNDTLLKDVVTLLGGRAYPLLINSPATKVLDIPCDKIWIQDHQDQLGASCEKHKYTVVATSQYGKGRVVVISSGGILDNVETHSGNRQFAYNLLTWLTSD